MQYLDTCFFSDLQLWIVSKKLKGHSYNKIVSKYKQKHPNDSISKEAIKTCLKRSSLSLQWTKGCICGAIPLLSEVDVIDLKDHVIENSFDGNYLDIDDAVEKATFLRNARFQNATKFLQIINCFSIIEELNKEAANHEAGRTWVYSHVEELEADLRTPRNIELNRLINCTPEKMRTYTTKLFPVLDKINPALRFCADETMLQPTIHKKVLVPKNMPNLISPDDVLLPHITAMSCNHVIGENMPLFIILPSLKKLPNDLVEFQEMNQAIFASTSNGWQTRDTFLWFVICFINWVSIYRLKLDKN